MGLCSWEIPNLDKQSGRGGQGVAKQRGKGAAAPGWLDRSFKESSGRDQHGTSVKRVQCNGRGVGGGRVRKSWERGTQQQGLGGEEGRSRKGLYVLANVMTNALSCNDCSGYCSSNNNKKTQFHLWLLLNLLESISRGTQGCSWECGSVCTWGGSEFPKMSLTRPPSQVLNSSPGTFLVVWRLRLLASTTGSIGLIPGWET